MRLAIMEAKMTLIEVLSKFRIVKAPETKVIICTCIAKIIDIHSNACVFVVTETCVLHMPFTYLCMYLVCSQML